MSDPKQKKRADWKQFYPRDLAFRRLCSRQVCDTLRETPVFRAAAWVGIFFPRASEIDLTPLWSLRPQQVAFPRVDATTRSMVFCTVDSLESLVTGFGGLREPVAGSPVIERWPPSSLFLVPGSAFDRWGGRVGSGSGYYDRFLGPLDVHKWGVGYQAQISKERLDQDPTDVRMDALCTESGLIPSLRGA